MTETRHASNKNNEILPVVGRTWADLLSGFPLWMIGVSALVFVGIMIFSITLADRPYSMGFLGTFGPPAQIVVDNKPIEELKSGLLKWSDDPEVPGNSVGGGDAKPATMCPSGYYAAGINSWGSPGSTKYCVGCLNGIQVVCRKLNAGQ